MTISGGFPSSPDMEQIQKLAAQETARDELLDHIIAVELWFGCFWQTQVPDPMPICVLSCKQLFYDLQIKPDKKSLDRCLKCWGWGNASVAKPVKDSHEQSWYMCRHFCAVGDTLKLVNKLIKTLHFPHAHSEKVCWCRSIWNRYFHASCDNATGHQSMCESWFQCCKRKAGMHGLHSQDAYPNKRHLLKNAIMIWRTLGPGWQRMHLAEGTGPGHVMFQMEPIGHCCEWECSHSHQTTSEG